VEQQRPGAWSLLLQGAKLEAPGARWPGHVKMLLQIAVQDIGHMTYVLSPEAVVSLVSVRS
jgi:hypothetical protein